MNIVVKMEFGSHLYGTNTENSDRDYKGVFLPTREAAFLNRIPKSVNLSTNKSSEKNVPEDVDSEYYSLQYFIELACKGETVALDMLHSPKTIVTSSLWIDIVSQRQRFYTRNLKAFVGYARRQASKYGIKGSRLNDAKRVVDFFGDLKPFGKLSEVWDNLPEGEHIFKHEATPENNNLRLYEVCGRKMQETCSVDYAYSVIKKFHDNYGARAKLAAENKGIDWKAVSHALRAGYEVRQLLREGTITFPLVSAEFLKRVKMGVHDYKAVVAPTLDALMDEVERLSAESKLPDKVNRKFWEEFIVDAYDDPMGLRK